MMHRYLQKVVTLHRLTDPAVVLIDEYDHDQMSRGEGAKGGSDWKSSKHVINFDEPKPKETIERSVFKHVSIITKDLFYI